MNEYEKRQMITELNSIIEKIGNVIMMKPDINMRLKLSEMAQTLVDEVRAMQTDGD